MNPLFYGDNLAILREYIRQTALAHVTFKQAQRVQQPAGEQLGFEVDD